MNWLRTDLSDANSLKSLYRDFWTKASKHFNGILRPKELAIDVARTAAGDSLDISVGEKGEAVYAMGVPAPKLRAKAVDVYMRLSQTVRKAKLADDELWIATRCVLTVLYLTAEELAAQRDAWRLGNGTCTAHSGFHFVYDIRPTRCPECYVEYRLDGADEGVIRRKYKGAGDEWACRVHGSPKLPTAPMDLPGFLYVLQHDHLWEGIRNGWLRECAEAIDRLPKIVADGVPCCTFWYDRAHEPEPAPASEPIAQYFPSGFSLPHPYPALGWSARVYGGEKTETPHITLRRGHVTIRIAIASGALLDKNVEKVPEPIMTKLKETAQQWRNVWETRYPNPASKVGKIDWP